MLVKKSIFGQKIFLFCQKKSNNGQQIFLFWQKSQTTKNNKNRKSFQNTVKSVKKSFYFGKKS